MNIIKHLSNSPALIHRCVTTDIKEYVNIVTDNEEESIEYHTEYFLDEIILETGETFECASIALVPNKFIKVIDEFENEYYIKLTYDIVH